MHKHEVGGAKVKTLLISGVISWKFFWCSYFNHHQGFWCGCLLQLLLAKSCRNIALTLFQYTAGLISARWKAFLGWQLYVSTAMSRITNYEEWQGGSWNWPRHTVIGQCMQVIKSSQTDLLTLSTGLVYVP